MIKLKSKGFKKALTLAMVGLTTIASVVSGTGVNSSAHNAYFIAITIDEGNFRYVPTVIYEENDWVANNHREADIGSFSKLTVEANTSIVKDFTVPIITYFDTGKMDETAIKNAYKSIIAPGDGDLGLVFSFPGLHSRGFNVERRHATGKDEEMAYYVSETLVSNLNDAISWMAGKSGGVKKHETKELMRKSAELANKVNDAMRGKGSQSVQLGGQTFSIRPATASEINITDDRTTISDYVTLSHGTGANIEKVTYMCKISKGYQTRSDISNEYKDGLKKYSDPAFINWQYIVLQGNYSSDVNSITFSSVNEIIKPGSFELAISSFFGSLLGGLRTLLGLYPMEEVLLNEGIRNNSYYYGVMPKDWMSSASLLNFVSQIVAWTIMGFAFVRMLFKRQLATMNIGERVSLMEGIKDIFITCFLLAGFSLVFHSMIRMNYALVGLFSASSEFSSYIGTTKTMTGGGVMAMILINFAFFFINCYFNVVYVLRAFTIAMLYGLAPLAIVTISFGGKYKAIFSNYMKELVANIFLQTFHAMCVAFFTSVTSTTNMRSFELLTVLYAFIPLTNFVRQNIVGLPGGITDQASGLVGMGKSMVGGAVGGLVGGAVAKGGKGGKSGGGGSSSSGIDEGLRNKINNTGKSTMSTGGNKATQGIASAYNSSKNVSSNESIKGKDGLTVNGMSDGNNPLNTGGVSKHIGGDKKGKMEIAKNVAGALGKTGMAAFNAGSAIGFGSMGNTRMMEQGISGMRDNISGAIDSGKSAWGGNESFTDAGAKDLYKDHESSTMLMNDKEGIFNDAGFNGSQYERNFKEMRDCFAGEGVYGSGGDKEEHRQKALDYYHSQGINGMGQDKSGRTAINFSNKMYGNRDFSLKDVGNIATFDTSKIKND